MDNRSIPDRTPLVFFHDITTYISIFWFSITINRCRFRERLEAEFTYEAVFTGPVPFKGLPTMPDLPEMGISPVRVVGIHPVAQRAMGTARPIGCLRRILFDQPGQ